MYEIVGETIFLSEKCLSSKCYSAHEEFRSNNPAKKSPQKNEIVSVDFLKKWKIMNFGRKVFLPRMGRR